MSQIDEKIQDQKVLHFNTIRKILNKYSYLFTRFEEATIEQDTMEGFDVIFSFPDVKIPIRIRDFKYQSYMDFTIRSRSFYGMETEIHKLKKGFGDFYFYSWLSERNRIEKYIIVNLDRFRNVIDSPKAEKKYNKDNTEFMSYPMDLLIKSDSLIIYESLKL